MPSTLDVLHTQFMELTLQVSLNVISVQNMLKRYSFRSWYDYDLQVSIYSSLESDESVKCSTRELKISSLKIVIVFRP